MKDHNRHEEWQKTNEEDSSKRCFMAENREFTAHFKCVLTVKDCVLAEGPARHHSRGEY